MPLSSLACMTYSLQQLPDLTAQRCAALPSNLHQGVLIRKRFVPSQLHMASLKNLTVGDAAMPMKVTPGICRPKHQIFVYKLAETGKGSC